jgi:predicted nucleic acid-binding protein
VILADTSAWVEFDRATGSRVDRRLTGLLAGDQVCVTEPVVMEVVAGARDAVRERDLRRMLAGVHLLPFDSVVDLDAASRVYRRCRSRGITPRGMVDCMIAAVAWRTGAGLLAHDVDLVRVAATIDVSMDPASLHS